MAWTLNASDVPGASSSSYVPTTTGSFGCRATGSNPAGSATQSASVEVTAAFSTRKAKLNKRRGTAKLAVDVRAAGVLKLTGKGLAAQTKSSSSATTLSVQVKPTGATKRKLASKGKAGVKAKLIFTPAGGSPTSGVKKITLRQRLSG